MRQAKLKSVNHNRFVAGGIIGTLVAGQIYPAVTGESWNRGIEERLSQPLGMVESLASVRALEGLVNVATPHENVGGRTVAVAYDNVDAVAPAAAVISNVKDMSRWMRLHLNGGVFEGRENVGADVAAECQTVQIPLAVSAFNAEHFDADGRVSGFTVSSYYKVDFTRVRDE